MQIILDIASILVLAVLLGSMVFFSFVMAPLIFIKLEAQTAGRLVRAIFPWYYLLVAILAFLACVLLIVIASTAAIIMLLVSATALWTRQVLTPRINSYRDRMLDGDPEARLPFERSHRFSVVLNGGQLLLIAAVLIYLIVVL